MKIYCDNITLSDALGIVSKAVPSKSSVQILECVKLEAKGNELTISANNLELAIECKIQADVAKEGSIALSAKTFYEIVRKLPLGEVLIEADENYRATIICQKSEYRIMGLSSDEFPQIPEVVSERCVNIASSTLKSLIRQTSFAISQNETRQVLCGSLFEIKNEKIKVVSVDGFKMALRCEELKGKVEEEKFIIPGRTLSELLKILPDNEEEVSICYTGNHALIRFLNTKIVTRLIEGEFLNYEKIIPTEKSISITVSVKEFLSSIERAEPLLTSDTSKNPVILHIKYDKINIQCSTSMGQVNDFVEIPDCGGELKIGFNHKFLHDALKAAECESIIMEFNTALCPLVIKPVEGDSFLFMVLPVRLAS